MINFMHRVTFFPLFSGGALAVALAGLPHEILLDPTREIP
jgi:hypothetical protein